MLLLLTNFNYIFIVSVVPFKHKVKFNHNISCKFLQGAIFLCGLLFLGKLSFQITKKEHRKEKRDNKMCES